MYNDEFNNNDMYRFTNREVPRDDYAPAPRQENTYTAPVKKQAATPTRPARTPASSTSRRKR